VGFAASDRGQKITYAARTSVKGVDDLESNEGIYFLFGTHLLVLAGTVTVGLWRGNNS